MLQKPINSLPPGRCGSNLKSVDYNLWTHVFQGYTSASNCEIAVGLMPQNTFHDKSSLVQVMTWCHQATGHYLSQCRLRHMTQYGVTLPQWVNGMLTFVLIMNDFVPPGGFDDAIHMTVYRQQRSISWGVVINTEWHWTLQLVHSLKTDSRYDANFAVTGGIAGCHNDHPLCRQWRRRCHHGDFQFQCEEKPHGTCTWFNEPWWLELDDNVSV